MRSAQLSQLSENAAEIDANTHPYRHVVDEVNVAYSELARRYQITFRKIIRNQSTQPVRNFYARIMVCGFPKNTFLAQRHHRENPISLDSLKFESFDDSGIPLLASVIHQEPSNLEILIWFKDRDTGRSFPLLPGEEKSVFYRIEVSDDIWGPFLLRHIRWDCDEVAVSLAFPSNCVKIWGEMMGVNSKWPAIDPPLERRVGSSELWEPVIPSPNISKEGKLQVLRWSMKKPPTGSFFRFAWEFIDKRDGLKMENIKTKYEDSADSSAPQFARSKVSMAMHCIENGLVKCSDDFRSVYWFGNWYYFSPQQARCVEILWSDWTHGRVGIAGDVLLEAAESNSQKLSSIFRRSSAWKDGIIYAPWRGVYSLRVPKTLENSGHVSPK